MEGFKFKIEDEPKKPWEELRSKEESKFIEKYRNEVMLDKDTRSNIDQILTREAEEKQLDFAEEWFWKHREDVEKMGYNPNSKEKREIVNIVKEMGGFNDEEWKNNKDIEELYIFKSSIAPEKKNPLELNTSLLILNSLSNRVDKLELDIALKKGDGTSRKEKKKELKEIFKTQKEIVEKISGRDLEQESWDKMGRGPIQWFTTGLFSSFIGISFLYLEQKKRFTPKFIKEEIAKYAQAPEKAEGGIENVYKQVAEKLITEFITEKLKKDEKSKEELEAIKKEFSGPGVKIDNFLDSLIHRKEELRNLNGNWSEDKNGLEKFLGRFNIPLSGLEANDEGINQAIKEYKSAIKKQVGFVKWFTELVSRLFMLDKKKP